MSERITDLTFLQSFTGGNKEKMNKYMGIFLQLCPTQLEAMQTHLQNNNYDALRATAHSLKPQITYMGIKQGEGIVKNIEQYAGEKINLEQLPQLLSSFKEICEKAITELKEEILKANAWGGVLTKLFLFLSQENTLSIESPAVQQSKINSTDIMAQRLIIKMKRMQCS